MPHLEARTPYSNDHAACRGWRNVGAISARPRMISRTTATPDAMPPQCTSYNIRPLYPAIRGKMTTSTPPLMCAAPPCDYKRRRRASFRLSRFAHFARFSRSLSLSQDAQTLLGFSYCGHLRSRSSPYPTPLLAETCELPSLSRLACTPYYKHSGCKIIQCPRTSPLLDIRPRGRN